VGCGFINDLLKDENFIELKLLTLDNTEHQKKRAKAKIVVEKFSF